MSAAKEELTKSWLMKAKRDLLSAYELAGADFPLLDTAAYHCQQAAEKSIKGFLLFHDVRFEKTHDIGKPLGSGLTFCHSMKAILGFEFWISINRYDKQNIVLIYYR